MKKEKLYKKYTFTMEAAIDDFEVKDELVMGHMRHDILNQLEYWKEYTQLLKTLKMELENGDTSDSLERINFLISIEDARPPKDWRDSIIISTINENNETTQ